VTHKINGPLPSERQKNLVIGLLAQRKITGKELQADHVGAMNADELREWLKVKLNRIPTNEQRSFVADRFGRAQQAAEGGGEGDGVERDSGDSRDEQPTPPRGTLPPITVGRANEDGVSVFGDDE
jgi:hypothetical protein